jgi:hypothetical protein
MRKRGTILQNLLRERMRKREKRVGRERDEAWSYQ